MLLKVTLQILQFISWFWFYCHLMIKNNYAHNKAHHLLRESEFKDVCE